MDFITYAKSKKYTNQAVAIGGNPEETKEIIAEEVSKAISQLPSTSLIPESISITKTKTRYSQSEEFSIDDLVVVCNYTDGSSKEIKDYTTNMEDIDTNYGGTKLLKISYSCNGYTVSESIPIIVEFNDSFDSVQYAFKVSKDGILKSSNLLASCSNKIIRYSKLRLRLKLYVYIDFNSLSKDCKISCGNDTLWGQEALLGSITIPAKQTGMFQLDIDKEIEFDNTNITTATGAELVLLTSDGGMNIQGYYEMKDISIALTEPVQTLPYSLHAVKAFTYAVLGEDMATDDITVTCTYNTDAKAKVTNYESNIDELIQSETYGDKTVNVYYTEGEKTVTTTFNIHFFEKKREESMPFTPMKAYDWYNAWTHGINLGNAFDPYFSATNPNGIGNNVWSTKGDKAMCSTNERLVQETRWFQPKYTEQDIKNAADAGIQMVRIPITWSVNGYKSEDGMIHIGKYFSYRIREVLNWCHKYGLYALVNTHHDSKILYDLGVSSEKLEQKKEWARVMWTEIAELLKDYDQTVAFEGFNEIDNLKQSWMPSAEAQLQMNELNQVFVDAVRATGGNNLKRVLCCPVLIHKGYAVTFDNFVVPNDVEEGYIGTAVHWYADNYVQGIDSMLKFYEQKADILGIPVMVNEFGKSYSYNDRDVLTKYYQNYVARARHFNVAPVAWDNGSNYTLLLKVNDSKTSSGKWHSEMRPSTFANGDYAQKYQEAMIRGSEGYAWSVGEEQYMCFKEEVNDWYLGIISNTGEEVNNSWNGKVSPFIEVKEGETLAVVFSRNSSLSMEKKMQIGSYAFYDSDHAIIELITPKYGADTVSATVPEGARYVKVMIFSKHYNVSESDFATMFTEDMVEIMHYKETDVFEVALPDRTPQSLDILDIKTEYQIGEEFNPSIKAKVLYNDGQYLSVRDGLTIDSSSINNQAKGKYPITISYESGGVSVSTIETIVYGLWIKSLLLYNEDTLSIKVGEVTNDNILNYLNPILLYTDNSEVAISKEDLSLDVSEVDFDNIGKYTISASYEDPVEGTISASLMLELWKWAVYKQSSTNIDEYNAWVENYIQLLESADAWAKQGLETMKTYYASGNISVIWTGSTVYLMKGNCWYDGTSIYSEYPIVRIANMKKGIMQTTLSTGAQFNGLITTKDSTDMYYCVAVEAIRECVNDIYSISDVSEIKDIVVTLDSISATKTTTSYSVGDTFESSDIVVTANYSNGSTKDITSDATVDTRNANMNEANTFSITISYTEGDITKTTSIEITVSAVTPEPEPEPSPVVPQTGTWQLKTTPNKKYIILSTDDDNVGNTKFFRLLRTYGFPYTMNVEAENMNKNIGSDIDNTVFTDTDAPALFSEDVTVSELGKYLMDTGLGEVTQHGSSAHALWDSNKLTGTFLDELYESYISQGGTRTKDELVAEIKLQLAASDIAQGAVYVEESKETIENAIGYPIYALQTWGGVPIATVDGIECNLNSIKGGEYDYRGHNYVFASPRVVQSYKASHSLYEKTRNFHTVDIQTEIDKIAIGDIEDFFSHMPYHDLGNEALRQMLDIVKANVDAGIVEVVTPTQYYNLGEWVDNPIISISISRNNISLGDSDTDSAYIITATYEDGTTADVSNEAIIDRNLVNTSEVGKYTVSATYRGFNSTLTVSVIDSSYTIPEGLKDTEYWFIAKNETQNKLMAGNTTGKFGTAGNYGGMLKFSGNTGGKMNGWVSTDDGATWTQVNKNDSHYGTVGTNGTTITENTTNGVPLNFAHVANDVITFLETSRNFEINYGS